MTLTVHRGSPFEYQDDTTAKGYFSWSQVATLLDPSYEEAPEWRLAKAAERGTAVHYLAAFLIGSIHGFCDPPTIEPGMEGYAEAVKKFAIDYQVRPKLVEVPSHHPLYPLAGTLDMLAWVTPPQKPVEVLAVLDYKSGVKNKIHRIQCGVYRTFVDYKEATASFLVYLRPDGTYEVASPKLQPADFPAVLNAVQILTWRVGN